MDEEVTPKSSQTDRRPLRVWLGLSVAIIVIAAAAIILSVVGVSPFSVEPYAYHGLQFDAPEPAPDFTLIDQNRQPFRLSDHQGQVVMLYFGFTHCPDECPITLGTWKQVSNLLEDEADQVRFVMVTVDPERDTPERMAEYLAVFNPDFVGLSGSVAEIEDVALPYSVFFKKLPVEEEEVRSAHLTEGEHGHADAEDAQGEEHYLVAHTTLTYVIDPDGQLVLAYPLGAGAQEIAADLRHLVE